MNMKINYQILAIVLSALTLSGCKKECIKNTMAGTYTMDITVIKRPPVINFDSWRPDVIPFDHIEIAGQIIDTTQEVCCFGDPNFQDSCYRFYTLSGPGLQIIENDEQLFFKNSIYSIGSTREEYNVPFFERNDSLIYIKFISESIPFFHRSDDEINSTAYHWPRRFDILYFAIEKKSSDEIRGRWIIKDLEYNRSCQAKMSDGNSYRYFMGEIAEFTLTKVE